MTERATWSTGQPVYIATPTFTYYPPAPVQPCRRCRRSSSRLPRRNPPVLQFGQATWVKDIKTTTHNANKVELADLVDPDPDNPDARNWTNGEPAEVETEWRILQTEFANAANPKGELAGVPQDIPGGDEVVTRRYEFYKYTGPIDAESGEAMADTVGPDGIHGVGTVTYNDHIDPTTGEWVEVTVDLSTVEVVGDFIGAQMSGFDVAPALGLIDHIPGRRTRCPLRRSHRGGRGRCRVHCHDHVRFTSRRDDIGRSHGRIFRNTDRRRRFHVHGSSLDARVVPWYQRTNRHDSRGPCTARRTITTSASPSAGGTTTGGGVFDNGTPSYGRGDAQPGLCVRELDGERRAVSASAVYPFTVSADRTLVANFVPVVCGQHECFAESRRHDQWRRHLTTAATA